MDNCTGEQNIKQMVAGIEDKFEIPAGMDLMKIVNGYVSTLLKAELIQIVGDVEGK